MWKFQSLLVQKSAVILLTLLLSVGIVMASCGDNDDEPQTATAPPLATPSAETSQTGELATRPTEHKEPVKIGAIISWSGPMAMAGLALADPIIELVEEQVEQMGGILGGRPVEVIKFDNEGQASMIVAGLRKLVHQDDVSVICFGGVTQSEVFTTLEETEDLGVLYVAPTPEPEDLSHHPYVVRCAFGPGDLVDNVIDLALKVIKPATVGLMVQDDADHRAYAEAWKKHLEAADIEIVSEQYTPLDSVDYSPYLTHLKYDDPDMAIIDQPMSGSMTTFNQIMELGGWGDIQVLSTYPGAATVGRNKEGAVGTYVRVSWIPGLEQSGAKAFEEAYFEKFGKAPDINMPIFYNGLWTAIRAIELAGTDTDRREIARAARSGELEWDTPMGYARFTTDGESNLHTFVVKIEADGTFTKVEIPQE